MNSISITKESVTDPTTPSKPFGWRFTFPLLLGSTLNPINSSMLATGLVGIAVDFGTGPGQAAILVSVLYLCSAVAQPTMGKLSTLFGPRRVFLVGIVILFIGGVVGAFAPAFGVLLISRALIGIGTSAAYPTAMAMVRRRADRLGVGVPTRVLGNFTIAAQVTIVVGLPIGGVLAGAFGWRALFLVNVPLAILTFLFAYFGIERDTPVVRQRGGLVRAIDLPGIALFAVTVVSLLVFLSDLATPAWWLLPVTAAALAGLVLWERAASAPLIDVRALGANGPLLRTYLRQILVGLGVYTTLYGTSQWMEGAAGLTPLAVGLILLPLSGLGIVSARLSSNLGAIRLPLIVAASSLVVTGGVMLFIHAQSGVLVLSLIGMSLLFGLTNGLSAFANQAALYVQSPAETIAVTAGLYRTASYIGAIFSSSLISIVFGSQVTDGGLQRLAWAVLGIGIASTLLTVLDRTIPARANPPVSG